RASPVRPRDDGGPSARRSRAGQHFLSRIRRRYYAQRRRVLAATRLQCSAPGGSARTRFHYGNRDPRQRSLAGHGAGAAARRYDAPRPQTHRSGTSKEMDRRRQQTYSRKLQESLRDLSRHKVYRPYAAHSGRERRRGAHPLRAGVYPPAQERDRLRVTAVSPLRREQVRISRASVRIGGFQIANSGSAGATTGDHRRDGRPQRNTGEGRTGRKDTYGHGQRATRKPVMKAHQLLQDLPNWLVFVFVDSVG